MAKTWVRRPKIRADVYIDQESYRGFKCQRKTTTLQPQPGLYEMHKTVQIRRLRSARRLHNICLIKIRPRKDARCSMPNVVAFRRVNSRTRHLLQDALMKTSVMRTKNWSASASNNEGNVHTKSKCIRNAHKKQVHPLWGKTCLQMDIYISISPHLLP